VYNADHKVIAKAVRDAGASINLTDDDMLVLATALADACESRTRPPATLDREQFMAYALSPVIGVPAKAAKPTE
jgi:hypothetical protein